MREVLFGGSWRCDCWLAQPLLNSTVETGNRSALRTLEKSRNIKDTGEEIDQRSQVRRIAKGDCLEGRQTRWSDWRVLTGMGFVSPVCGEREEHVSGRLLKHPKSATDDQVLFLLRHLSPLSRISINLVVNSLAFVSAV